MCNMRESGREKETHTAKRVGINECEGFLELSNFEPGNELQLCVCIHLGAEFLLQPSSF